MRVILILYLFFLSSCELSSQEARYNVDDTLSLDFHKMYSALNRDLKLKDSEEWKQDRLQFVGMSCTDGSLVLDTIYGEGPLEISYIEMENFRKFLNLKSNCNSDLNFVYAHLDMEKKMDKGVSHAEYYKNQVISFINRNKISAEIKILPRSFSAKVFR